MFILHKVKKNYYFKAQRKEQWSKRLRNMCIK